MSELKRITDGYGNVLSIMDTFVCRQPEEYKTDLKFSMHAVFSEPDPRVSQTVTNLNITTYASNRCFVYVSNANAFLHCSNYADNNQTTCLLSGTTLNRDQTTGSFSDATDFPFGTDPSLTNFEASISTNIPIFLSNTTPNAIINEYMNNSTTLERINEILEEYALNYSSEYSQQTQDYYIFNTYDTCNIDMGIVTYTGGNPVGRFEIFKANSEPCLYFVDEDNSCELGLIAGNIVGSVYSSINKEAVLSKQFDPDEWERGALVYSGPFYHPLTYLPDGNYTIGVTWDTNVYIAHNRQQAEDYLAGLVSPEELYNYGNVGNPKIASNETGTKELTTTFGGNESENVFSHDYMMSRTELADIGGKFFDTNILNALLDGLKLYGNANPMESVLGCLYFPFDLSTVCPDYTAVTDIYFGSYKMENVSANKIKHRSGYKEMGSTFIKPTFYNWLDYKAMHVYLYLAYIGFVELDVNKYLNKTLKIIYMVDIHSGECEVSLLADGLLMDTYSGQIGIKQPITYNDLATYFQSQITALRNGVMSVVGGPIAGAGTGAQIGSSGGPYGMLAGAVTGASLGQTVGTANGMWQGWKVSHTKPPLFSKGGYSSEIGANMPQYCFLVFMYNDVEIPANLLSVYGKPSNKSGNVGSFSGFLSTNYVKLQCPTATDEEKAEIVSLLNSGIYI